MTADARNFCHQFQRMSLCQVRSGHVFWAELEASGWLVSGRHVQTKQTTRKCVNVEKKIIRSFQKNRDCYVGKLLNYFLHVNNILVEGLQHVVIGWDVFCICWIKKTQIGCWGRHAGFCWELITNTFTNIIRGGSSTMKDTTLEGYQDWWGTSLRRSNWWGMAVSIRNFIFSWIVWTTVWIMDN